jgi:hypothetical protein
MLETSRLISFIVEMSWHTGITVQTLFIHTLSEG